MALQQGVKSSFRRINGVVVSSGLMEKTVKVRIGAQRWDKYLHKHWNGYKHLLVHDPSSSLRTGDVVSVSPGWRASKCVRHVVTSIIAPFGNSIDERPPVPTEDERLAERAKKRAAKDGRRALTKLGAQIDTIGDGLQEIETEMRKVEKTLKSKRKA